MSFPDEYISHETSTFSPYYVLTSSSACLLMQSIDHSNITQFLNWFHVRWLQVFQVFSFCETIARLGAATLPARASKTILESQASNDSPCQHKHSCLTLLLTTIYHDKMHICKMGFCFESCSRRQEKSRKRMREPICLCMFSFLQHEFYIRPNKAVNN